MDGFLTISHWLQEYTDSKVTSGERGVDWILLPSFPPTPLFLFPVHTPVLPTLGHVSFQHVQHSDPF